MESKDRRRYPRLEGHFRVDLLNLGDDPNVSNWESIIEGEALDISMQGMRIKAFYNVGVGSLVSVVVYYKDRESICLSEVVWKREILGEFIYGLHFKEWTSLDPALARRFDAMQTDEADALPVPRYGPTGAFA